MNNKQLIKELAALIIGTALAVGGFLMTLHFRNAFILVGIILFSGGMGLYWWLYENGWMTVRGKGKRQ